MKKSEFKVVIPEDKLIFDMISVFDAYYKNKIKGRSKKAKKSKI